MTQRLLGGALVLVVLAGSALLLVPRGGVVAISARTDTLRFRLAERRELLLTDAVFRENLAQPFVAGSGTLTINEGTCVEVTRIGSGPVSLGLTHAVSTGGLNGRRLGGRAWVLATPTVEAGIVLPFSGPFTIGNLVGQIQEAILHSGVVEILEVGLWAETTYVNTRFELLPGDYVVAGRDAPRCPSETSGPASGFLYIDPAGSSRVDGIQVRAETDPVDVRLLRSARRPPLRLRPTYWGRLSHANELALLVVLLSCAAALVQTFGFFFPSATTTPAPSRHERLAAPVVPSTDFSARLASQEGRARVVSFGWLVLVVAACSWLSRGRKP